MLAFKRIVTTAAHVLDANKLPISHLRDLLLAVNKDSRDMLLANVADPLIASFFHDEYDQQESKGPIVIVARRYADGDRCPSPVHEERQFRPDHTVLAGIPRLLGELLARDRGSIEADEGNTLMSALFFEFVPVEERATPTM
jgi:hypothetical protein